MRKEAYKHDYSGACAPGRFQHSGPNTFSVGIFQWVPTSNGKSLKKSAVKYRVRGYFGNQDAVFERVRELCMCFDQAYEMDPYFKMPKKSETVG